MGSPLDPVSAAFAGMSGISQIGHFPGRSRRTCGCIEHVYMLTVAVDAAAVPAVAAPGSRRTRASRNPPPAAARTRKTTKM
jgi:hypothetical protein